MMKLRTVATLALGAIMVGALAGCGSGGGGGGGGSVVAPQATGSARVDVLWGDGTINTSFNPSRVIPAATASIRVDVFFGATQLATQLIVRPAATHTFAGLPVGNLSVVATAYPNADGSGTAQATATAPLTILDSQTTPLTITLASTIDHIDVTPVGPSVAVGMTRQLTATPKDASNNVVMVTGSITWSSGTPTVATVNSSTGVVTGVAGAGSTVITATESDSGKTGTTTVTGIPKVIVNVSPASASIAAGGTQTYSASVTGTDNQSVSWSVQEGATGGTVTAGGVFTMGYTVGTYHVVATPAVDGTVTGNGLAILGSGSGAITIQ